MTMGKRTIKDKLKRSESSFMNFRLCSFTLFNNDKLSVLPVLFHPILFPFIIRFCVF